MIDEIWLKRQFDILGRIAIDASDSNAVWRHFTDPNTHEEYQTQLEIYVPSFNAIERAASIATIVCLGKFSDEAKGSTSFPRLQRKLRQKSWCPTVVNEVQTLYEMEADTWPKINKLRNKVFAHSESCTGEKHWFSEVGITPNQITNSTSTARNIVIKLQESIGKDYSSINSNTLYTSNDLKKLFKNLKVGREARLREVSSIK